MSRPVFQKIEKQIMALCFYSFFCSSPGYLALVLHWDYIELRTEKKAMSSAKRAHNGNQWSFEVVFDNSCYRKINKKSTSLIVSVVKISQDLSGQTNQRVRFRRRKKKLRSIVLVQGLQKIRANLGLSKIICKKPFNLFFYFFVTLQKLRVLSVLSLSQPATVLISIYQNDIWTIRR